MKPINEILREATPDISSLEPDLAKLEREAAAMQIERRFYESTGLFVPARVLVRS